ncbi:hypothetical protein GIB67_039316 [Kingdonia uniflora]|uniref:Uncharacterized protein n=1 Tax=Kingdonia uniflora TaxID=39325 RepID=A0A7J7MM22_9MAGN|nr:hypothetical protein GIB67_039316 [Kingdonia uniflora]
MELYDATISWILLKFLPNQVHPEGQILVHDAQDFVSLWGHILVLQKQVLNLTKQVHPEGQNPVQDALDFVRMHGHILMLENQVSALTQQVQKLLHDIEIEQQLSIGVKEIECLNLRQVNKTLAHQLLKEHPPPMPETRLIVSEEMRKNLEQVNNEREDWRQALKEVLEF